jgi:hypothetical protein
LVADNRGCFVPMRLRQDFGFNASIHAAAERIPVETVAFGADAIYQTIQRFLIRIASRYSVRQEPL